MEKRRLVKEEITKFSNKHVKDSSLSLLDDIMLDYIVGLLEEIGSEPSDSSMSESADFQTIIGDYVDGFSDIDTKLVHDWLLTTAKCLASAGKEYECLDTLFTTTTSLSDSATCKKENRQKTRSESSQGSHRSHRTRKRTTSSTSSTASTASQEEAPTTAVMTSVTPQNVDQSIAILLEMFPKTCKVEARHCLEVSGWCVDKAAGVMLHRQETGDDIRQDGAYGESHTGNYYSQKKAPINEHEMKEQIIQRYSYIDESDDVKKHNPRPPKTEPKKLVRYRDSQVVSMKGERFSETKKTMSDDEKKTYINLKPARQYRFH